MEEKKWKNINYPIVMMKGDAFRPARFWEYKVAMDLHDAINLDKRGFVRTNEDPSEYLG